MSLRHRLTISDYAVVALCPALIVLLLSSLVYFVILSVYQGGYSSRLGYIWFMFILGAVNIARLSIEQSRTYATGYAAVLGLATFFVLSRFQTLSGPAAALGPLVTAGLIAIVWLLADRITYDCTQIEDDRDASGQGLLDGLTSSESQSDAAVDSADAVASKPGSGQRTRRRRGPPQPGRTVFWLTAAALPLFGFGQALLGSDSGLLQAAAMALAVYLFATLSLLVATSFLGVRRYLRQRGVEMPRDVSAAWLGGGMLLTAIILVICFALPQPGRMLAQLDLPTRLESPEGLSPSRFGWGDETTAPEGQGEATSGDESSADAPPGDTAAESAGDSANQSTDGDSASANGQPGGESTDSAGESAADDRSDAGESSGDATAGDGGESGSGNDRNSDSSGDNSSGDASSGERRSTDDSATDNEGGSGDAAEAAEERAATEAAEDSSAEDQASGTPAESQSRPSPPSPSLPSLGGLLKAIVYLILLTIIAAFLWVNRQAIADAWRRFCDWIAGRRRDEAIRSANQLATVPAAAPRPFASFTNPLDRGVAPRRAVIETFQATEAWYRERGQPRKIDETPQEFARRVVATAPHDHQPIERLIDAYNRVVYGGGGADAEDLKNLRLVWRTFRHQSAPAASPQAASEPSVQRTAPTAGESPPRGNRDA